VLRVIVFAGCLTPCEEMNQRRKVQILLFMSGLVYNMVFGGSLLLFIIYEILVLFLYIAIKSLVDAIIMDECRDKYENYVERIGFHGSGFTNKMFS
jgi:hypothetical protein